MKSTALDFKSVLVGLLCASLLFVCFSFKTDDGTIKEGLVPPAQVGTYQAVASERGFIILNTQTGEYILDSEVNYIGKMTWIKGDFDSAFERGVDKTRK